MSLVCIVFETQVWLPVVQEKSINGIQKRKRYLIVC